MISNLEDHLGYWLRRLSNQVSHTFGERLARHDISVAQWVVLRVLHDHEALALKDLCVRIGVDQGALSRMVGRMAARGLVSRTVNPRSRREVAISLTAAGRRLVPVLARTADENDRAFFGKLPKARRAELHALIQTLLALNPSVQFTTPID